MALAERPYQRQVGPGGLTPPPMTSPDAFGASVGRALEQAAGTAGNIALQQHETELEDQFRRDFGDASKRAAEVRAKIAAEVRNREQNPAPGGAGHEVGIAELYDNAVKDFMPTIPNERIAQRITPVFEDDRLRTIERAGDFEAKMRGAQRVNDMDEQTRFAADTIAHNPIVDTYLSEADALHEHIFAGEGGFDEKQAYWVEKRKELALALMDSMDPQAAKDELATGRWDGIWDYKERASLLDRLDSKLNHAAMLQRQQDNAALDLVKAQEDELLALADKHTAIDPTRAYQMAEAARKRGDLPKAVRLEAAGGAAAYRQPFIGAPIPAITAEIERIQRVPGWQGDVKLVSAVKELENERENVLHSEPPIPLPDIENPQSRDAWLKKTQAWYRMQGIPPEAQNYLFGDVKRILVPMMDRGQQGQEQALAYISHFPDKIAFNMAQGLAPSDKVFQLAASFSNPRARELAVQGRWLAQEKGDTALVTEKEMQRELDALRTATTGFEPDIVNSTIEAAVAITAALHRQTNKTHFDHDLAMEGVRLALDGDDRGHRGGIGMVNGKPFVLPTNMNQREWDDVYWTDKGTAGFMVDEHRPSWDEIRRTYHPVAWRDGRYLWIAADGRPLVADGHTEPVTFDPHELPKRKTPMVETPDLPLHNLIDPNLPQF